MMENRQTRSGGFTLMELLIVLAVMMVVTVAAFPTIAKNLQVMKLQTSAQDVATLMQRTRILAVKNNTVYSVIFVNTNGIQEACIDVQHDLNCDAGDPVVALATNVSLVTDGSGPSTNPITCGPVGPAPCPGGATGLNYNPQGTNVYVSYNNRGLPCVGTPATSEPSPTGSPCSEFVAGGTPVGFLYEFQYAGSSGKSYAAVTLTPSGLVGEWMYSGTNWGQI